MEDTISSEVIGENYERITLQMRGGFTRKHKSLTLMEVNLHGGFPYEAYNPLGAITPWSLLKIVELIRVIGIVPLPDDKQTFLDLGLLKHSVLLFIASTSCKVEPELYDDSIVKAPLRFTLELVKAGKSSHTAVTKMYVPSVQKPVLVNTLVTVLVDPKTRKPTTAPDWWMKKFVTPEMTSAPAARHESIKLQDGVPGNEIMEHSFQVPVSDSDINFHTNFSLTAKYFYDAIFANFIKQLSLTKTYECKRNAKEFYLTYKSEAQILDFLKVKFQKCSENENKFKCLMMKSDSLRVASECSMEFYAPKPVSRL